ncbi:hypothetical protein OBV_06060 [Oscillibacter valericigenes Sjm18-20]|nr:hypothetical protein OBV_06060 [Oscillibacter valericigenes Sjm18-20]
MTRQIMPFGSATRGQVTAILQRFCQNVAKEAIIHCWANSIQNLNKSYEKTGVGRSFHIFHLIQRAVAVNMDKRTIQRGYFAYGTRLPTASGILRTFSGDEPDAVEAI